MSVADDGVSSLTINSQALSGLGQHCILFASTTVPGEPEMYYEPFTLIVYL